MRYAERCPPAWLLVSTLLLAGTAMIGCAARGPAPPPGPIGAVLEPIRARYGLPALAAVVVTEDGTIVADAVGRRRRFDPTPVTVADRWHLGSNTRAFTATLIGRLVEDHRLDWSTTLADVFPDDLQFIHPDYRRVAVQTLLTHSAGLPHDFRLDGAWERARRGEGSLRSQRLDLVLEVLRERPAYAPGTRHEYSNCGFVLAGVIAERSTGRCWEELMRDSVLTPLGIRSEVFGAPGARGRADQPRGHRNTWLGPWPVEPGARADNPPAHGPAGTLSMSLEDYGRFLGFHMGCPRLDGAREGRPLLTQATLEHLHADADSSHFGLGWGVNCRDWADTVLTHVGSNGRWYAKVWLAPQRGIGLAVMTNCATRQADRACEEAGEALARAALHRGP